jgi:hypothetical protein
MKKLILVLLLAVIAITAALKLVSSNSASLHPVTTPALAASKQEYLESLSSPELLEPNRESGMQIEVTPSASESSPEIATTQVGFGALAGHLYDEKFQPAAGKMIQLVRGEHLLKAGLLRAKVGSEGEFLFENVPSGSWEVCYQGSDELANPFPTKRILQKVEIVPGETAVAELVLTGSRKLSGFIKARINSPEDEGTVYLLDLVLEFNPNEVVAQTLAYTMSHHEDSGKFSIEGLEADRYVLQVRRYKTERNPLEIPIDLRSQDQTTEREISDDDFLTLR